MLRNGFIFALCSLVIIFAGCSRGGSEEVLSLRHNEVDSLDLSQALSITQIVPLDNQVPVDKIIQVKRNQSGIYVWAGNQINRYSSDGKYLGIVGRVGRGVEVIRPEVPGRILLGDAEWAAQSATRSILQ